MKHQILICIIYVTLSLTYINSNKHVDQSRNFLKGFLSAVDGKDYELNDNCLGHNFKEEVDKAVQAIKKENSILLFTLLYSMKQDIETNCPSIELSKIFNDVKASFESGDMMIKAANHSKDLMHDLNLLLDEDHPEKVGYLIGKLVNILVYDKTEASYFLAFLGTEMNRDVEHILNMTKKQVEFFVDGFFEGVSSVPFDQNLCNKDLAIFREDIVEVFNDLIIAVKSRTNIINSFIKVYNLVLKLNPLNDNCHITSLSVNLLALSTKFGIAKLVFNFTKDSKGTYNDLKGVYSNIESHNFRDAGISFGSLTKLGLNYSTK